jgi:hypothetical protein
MPVIPALRMLKQDYLEFEASLNYIERVCLKKKKKKKKTQKPKTQAHSPNHTDLYLPF